MKSMSEIINLFVDGHIATNEQARRLMREEAAEYRIPTINEATFITIFMNSVVRLLPPQQITKIHKLLTPPLPEEWGDQEQEIEGSRIQMPRL